jgi:hypothetical protein
MRKSLSQKKNKELCKFFQNSNVIRVSAFKLA